MGDYLETLCSMLGGSKPILNFTLPTPMEFTQWGKYPMNDEIYKKYGGRFQLNLIILFQVPSA